MGWFWADTSDGTVANAPHPLLRSSASPPPSCPMHISQPSTSFPPVKSVSTTPNTSCPIKASNTPLEPSEPHSSSLSKLNPLNYMPSNISQSRAKSQTIALPIERTISSIPRGDAETNWEYPSPQQMYNAMLRKGYDDTPEDAVESMVAVHNFLNEGAWEQIEGWERRFSQGLGYGWRMCQMGEEEFSNFRSQAQIKKPKLSRFQGRPNEITPKARMLAFLGWLYPTKYGCEPPFDRHDWYVQRQSPDGQSREVRYVIDYYSGPPEPTGEPVFYLDVRPAIDGPTAALERMMRWGGDVWHRASGAEARLNTSDLID